MAEDDEVGEARPRTGVVMYPRGDVRYRFGAFELDEGRFELTRDGLPVALQPKPLELLLQLVRRHPDACDRGALIDGVWGDTVVSESSLSTAVRAVRRALGETADESVIRTVRGRGYALSLAVEVLPEPARVGSGTQEAPASRVVGRDRPLSALRRHLDAARAGRRQAILVTGEPGIGKTSLIDAFVDDQVGASLLVALGRCRESYGEGEAFLPILEALASLCRGELGEVVIRILRRHAPSWLLQMPWVLEDAQREELERTVREVRRERMLREAAEALEAISRERPLLLVLEDLHWSDPSTVDVFSTLAHRTDPARLLILGSYRPIDAILTEHPVKALTRELVAGRRGTELSVTLLEEDDVEAYLRDQLGGDPPPGVSGLIHRRSEGNALFMVTYLSHLLAHECLERGDAGWEIRRSLAEIEAMFPDELSEIVERQVVRLARSDLELLECASVIGRDFSSETVASVLAAETSSVEMALEQLGRHEDFVRPTGAKRTRDGGVSGSYQFGHVLQQHALYRRIGAARRADLHARVAAQLTVEGAGPAQLAYHYHASGLAEDAIGQWERAGTLAVERWANFEAIGHFDAALSALVELPESPERDARELALLIAIGHPLRLVYGPAAHRVVEVYDRAAVLFARLEPGPTLYPMMAGLFAFYIGCARHRDARETVSRMMEVAEPLGEGLILQSALLMTGIVRLYMGELAMAVESMNRAIALRKDEAAYHFGFETEALCHLFSSLALQLMGRAEEALARADRGIAIARSGEDAYLLSMALQFASTLHRWQGNVAMTRECAEQVDAISQEEGFLLWVPVTGWILGWTRAREGSLADGIAAMTENLLHYEEGGTEAARTDYLAATAEACLEAGDTEAGLVLIDEGLSRAEASDERFAEAELHRVRGALLAAAALADPSQGAAFAYEQAEAAVLRAIEIARAQGARIWELRAATTLWTLRERSGDTEEAREILARVVATFDPSLDLPDLREARHRLSR